MKRILILTETAGNAHNACARAMKNELSKHGAEVKIVDVLKDFSTPMNVWLSDTGYDLAVSVVPKIYDMFFEVYMRLKPEKRYRNITRNTVLSAVTGAMSAILEFKPDAVYCTHYNGAITVSYLKLCYDLPFFSMAPLLDYIVTPFWESALNIDRIICANEDFVEGFVKKGFRREQILPLGFPIGLQPREKITKAEAREKLGMKDMFTVTVMFGGGNWSGGFKIFKDVLRALKGRTAQVVMINGRDMKAFKKIEKMKKPPMLEVVNVGFTDKVSLYLAATDIIINKYGGASIAEMMNAGLPQLITEKIPAQERHNLEYMKKKGAALSFGNRRELKEKLLLLMDDEKLRENLAAKTAEFGKSSLSEAANILLSAPDADYSAFENFDLTEVKKRVKEAVKNADKAQKEKHNY